MNESRYHLDVSTNVFNLILKQENADRRIRTERRNGKIAIDILFVNGDTERVYKCGLTTNEARQIVNSFIDAYTMTRSRGDGS